MAVDLDILKNKLATTFKNSTIDIYDEVGDGKHLVLNIVSDDFQNLSSLERHKLIYATLKEFMNHIHALSITAKTYKGD